MIVGNGEAILKDCFVALKDIKDESIDLLLTDPPYGMNFVSGRRRVQHKKIENDDNLLWLEDFVNECYRVMKDNTHGYVFCSFHKIDVFKQEFQKRFTIKNILIWEKNNHSSGDLKADYAPKYEMILFIQKGRRELLGGKRFANIFKFNRTQNELHPTEKPVDLICFLINNSTIKGEIVLDPFAGSFTTAVACQSIGRKFICIEIEDKYYNIGVQRIKDSIGLFDFC